MKIIYLLWVNIIKYSIILINMVHNLWKVCPNLSSQKKIRKNMLIQYEKSLSLNYFTLGAIIRGRAIIRGIRYVYLDR